MTTEQQASLMLWVAHNLLTDSQLDVVPPGESQSLRNLVAQEGLVGALPEAVAASEADLERPLPPEESRAAVIKVRVDQADSFLHDVNLPGYGDLLSALRRLPHAQRDPLTVDILKRASGAPGSR